MRSLPPTLHPSNSQQSRVQSRNSTIASGSLSKAKAPPWYYSPRFAMQERFTSPLLRFRIRPMCPLKKRVQAWDISKPVVIPQAIVAAEQYDRIIRLVARGIPVRLEVNISVRFYDDDPMSYNVIAEIPGTDLKDEVVMLGASLDSWHAGTGATDNAVGAATALEVTRILQSLGSKPRRTIRIGLWSAEEQGTRGSHAYVATHLGRRIDPPDGQPGHARFEFKPEYEKFDAYLNFDYGTGRIRGVFLQGNEAARPVFRDLLEPFKDLGASTVSVAGIGATDHMSFDEI